MSVKKQTSKNSVAIVQPVLVDPLLNIKQVCEILNVGKTTFYKYVGVGKRFPVPVQISPRRVGWRASEISALTGKGGAA